MSAATSVKCVMFMTLTGLCACTLFLPAHLMGKSSFQNYSCTEAKRKTIESLVRFTNQQLIAERYVEIEEFCKFMDQDFVLAMQFFARTDCLDSRTSKMLTFIAHFLRNSYSSLCASTANKSLHEYHRTCFRESARRRLYLKLRFEFDQLMNSAALYIAQVPRDQFYTALCCYVEIARERHVQKIRDLCSSVTGHETAT